MSYRVGIVGTGGIARAHGRAAAAVEGVELCAICDLSEEAVNRFGEEHQVAKRYLDLDQLLDQEELDIALVCTWGSHHAEVSNRIANSRKVRAILCEKPISSDSAECEGMMQAARANGVLLAEAFKFRYHPLHLKMKQLVDERQIGEVQSIRSTFTTCIDSERMKPEANWRFNPEQGGGAVYDLACYNIHHARFITGSEPQGVYAVGQCNQTCGVVETAAVLLDFPGRLTAHISVSFRCFGSQIVEIFGTRGYMRTEQAWNNEGRSTSVEMQLRDGGEQATFRFEPLDQFACQLSHLQDCLRDGTRHRIPPENSLGNMRVIDAVYVSMKSGEPVRLN